MIGDVIDGLSAAMAAAWENWVEIFRPIPYWDPYGALLVPPALLLIVGFTAWVLRQETTA